ncbi:hypothetical protein NC652_022968 [Populus alba x Populus x berolinensis]|nr:hypothetical protein NC652_022968 [Populus alba x Populus x berolinensis]
MAVHKVKVDYTRRHQSNEFEAPDDVGNLKSNSLLTLKVENLASKMVAKKFRRCQLQGKIQGQENQQKPTVMAISKNNIWGFQ